MKTPQEMRLTLKEKGITLKELAPVMGYSSGHLQGVLSRRVKMPQGFLARFDEAVSRVLNSRRKLKAASAALDLTEWQRGYLEGLIQGREDEIRAKHQARAARWKAAAKKYMEVIQEQEADRQMLVNASLWARAWKAAAKHYKFECEECFYMGLRIVRRWQKACNELQAHGLLQDFLDRLEKEEGGNPEVERLQGGFQRK